MARGFDCWRGNISSGAADGRETSQMTTPGFTKDTKPSMCQSVMSSNTESGRRTLKGRPRKAMPNGER